MSSGAGSQTIFGAGDSALGYLYQMRVAFLSSLRRLSNDQAFSVYLETLDDVVFDSIGLPLELFQLKHHKNSAANLTDTSPDIWKSLRVWIEGRSTGSISKDAHLYLVTTSAVADGSIAGYMLASGRNEAEAVKGLAEVAMTSSNAANAHAYKSFLGLSYGDQCELAASIIIVPSALSIDDVENDIRQEARLAVRRDHLDSFVSRLEGWWLRRCLKHLIGKSKFPILSVELESEMDDLRGQFVADALPVDEDILEANVDLSDYENAVFVHQARLAGVRDARVIAAVRDYYRAFEQRSRWVRENLLLVGELDKYERTLCEEWQLMFERTADEFGEMEAEEEQKRMAQRIYAWVEGACYPIRPRVNNPSISRGSFHILADQLKVGWHPHFEKRLCNLLSAPRVVA